MFALQMLLIAAPLAGVAFAQGSGQQIVFTRYLTCPAGTPESGGPLASAITSPSAPGLACSYSAEVSCNYAQNGDYVSGQGTGICGTQAGYQDSGSSHYTRCPDTLNDGVSPFNATAGGEFGPTQLIVGGEGASDSEPNIQTLTCNYLVDNNVNQVASCCYDPSSGDLTQGFIGPGEPQTSQCYPSAVVAPSDEWVTLYQNALN